MLARIVDNWLTSAGELGYQTAFAQLLASEGYRLLHAPVHHPFEHGKDIAAISAEGGLHAFQLKGGDLGLADLEGILGQLLALAGTAVGYPGVEPPRRPDRAFLVTNGRLTAPARDRLRAFNDGNRQYGFPPIESIERDQLVGRFVAAHEAYLPSELEDLNELLRLVLATGQGPFPVKQFAKMLRSILLLGGARSSRIESKRGISSATILTSYATGPWQRAGNHWAVGEGWLTLGFAILATAELRGLEDEDWLLSFELARDSARQAIGLLVGEACAAKDLVIPDFIDGLIYPARAALVCGYAAAFYLSERELADTKYHGDSIKALLLRELDYIKIPGEAAAGLLLMIATALELLGEPLTAAKIVLDWARSLTVTNSPSSEGGAPDPYHSINDVLLHDLGAESTLVEEQFAGEAYTLHIAVDWLARRDLRALVEKLWPAVTRIHLAEFAPSSPAYLLLEDDPEGEHRAWAPATPESWARLRKEAIHTREEDIPQRLWQHPYMLPYLPLIYPHRLNAALAKALDYVSTGRAKVTLLGSEGAE